MVDCLWEIHPFLSPPLLLWSSQKEENYFWGTWVYCRGILEGVDAYSDNDNGRVPFTHGQQFLQNPPSPLSSSPPPILTKRRKLLSRDLGVLWDIPEGVSVDNNKENSGVRVEEGQEEEEAKEP